MSRGSGLTQAEMQVAARRARGYPPDNYRRWGADPRFTEDSYHAARLLEAHPELLEAG